MQIQINNNQKTIKLPVGMSAKLRKVLAKAYSLYELPKNCEIGLVYVDNAGIKVLNKAYRGIDKETDVLSFAMFEGEEFPVGAKQPIMLGDIIISLEKAIEQAQEYGHSIDREVAYLVVHGFLHLLGYDHMTSTDKKLMRENEEYILEQLGLTRDSD